MHKVLIKKSAKLAFILTYTTVVNSEHEEKQKRK